MPTERCGSCRKFISPIEGVKCGKCNILNHRSCVSLPATTKIASTWRCPECRRGESRDNKDDTPVRGRTNYELTHADKSSNISPSHSTSLPVTHEGDMGSDFSNRELMDEIRAMRRDFMDFRREIRDMKAEVQLCHSRIESLEARVEAAEQRASMQGAAPMEVDKVITQLKQDLNDRDQDLLANDLEIRNIPEEKGENLLHLVGLIAAKIGLTLKTET